jgi:DNA-directed RNA polymerase specialized sigma24 family protein
MAEHAAEQVREKVDAVYRSESRRIFATLIRLLGDFELAEGALHDAFSAALERWPKEGVPANPRAWLVSAGRFRAIDAMRRRARFDASQAAIAEQLGVEAREVVTFEDESIEDDRLRLIFTCCHPALPPETRVALTLREVCGLTTEEIAHGVGSDGTPRADAAAGIAPRRADLADGRPDLTRRPGPLALESRSDRGRKGVGGKGAVVAPGWSIHASGGNRERACRRAQRRGDGLGADCRAIPTKGRSAWLVRSRNGGFSNGDWLG